MQALRGRVMHPSGVNIPRNWRRHRRGIGTGSSLSGASPRGDLGLVRILLLHTRPVQMRTHFCPGTGPEAAMATGEVTPFPAGHSFRCQRMA